MAVATSVNVASSTQATVLAKPTFGNYQFVAIGNTGTSTAYLKFFPDGGDVTATSGIPLPAGASLLLDQDNSPIWNNGVFAICKSGETTTLAVQAY